MPEIQPPGWLRTWVATLASSSVFTIFGSAVGGLLFLVAPWFKANQWAWFFAGTCIGSGILVLLYSTDWMFKHRVATLVRMREDKALTPEQFEREMDRVLAWRQGVIFPGRSKRTPRSKAKPQKGVVDDSLVILPQPVDGGETSSGSPVAPAD